MELREIATYLRIIAEIPELGNVLQESRIQPQMGVIRLGQRSYKILDKKYFGKADTFNICGNGYKIRGFRNGIIKADYPQVDWE